MSSPSRKASSVIVAITAACTSNQGGTSDGTYSCTLTQMRCGGGEVWPWGQPDGGGSSFFGPAQSFTLALAGTTMSATNVVFNTSSSPLAAANFTCTGTWSAGLPAFGTGETLGCVLVPGTDCNGTAHASADFAVVTAGTNPNSGVALAAGQVWAGSWPGHTPSDLSYVCQKQ